MAAGALVPEGMKVPPRSLVMGLPAKVRREVTEEERAGPAALRGELRRVQGEYRAAEAARVTIQAVRGTTRHPARRDRGLAPRRGRGARASSPATATARSARPSSRRRELFARGIGAETDIVSKEMYTFDDRDGGVADAAARGHRRDRARGDRAQPDEHRPRAARSTRSGRCSGASGRRRAATGSSTRWTSRPSASRAPTIDAEVIELALALPRGLRRRASYELVLNSVGDARLPAGLRRDAAHGAAREPATLAVRRLPAPHRDEPAARARLARCPRTRQLIDALPRIADHLCARVPRALRRGAAAARPPGHPLPARATGWCAASTTTCAPPSR